MTDTYLTKNENIIGIDRLVLCSIKIRSVDWSKLNSSPNTAVKQAVDKYRREVSECVIKNITIIGNHYRLEIGVATNKAGVINEYEKLEINPAAVLYGNNLINISSADQFVKALDRVSDDLLKTYGLDVDYSQAELQRIEINRNIYLDKEFCYYNKVFGFIQASLPKTLQHGQKHETGSEYTGFKVFNNELSLKFYDKERHAEIKICSGRILRVEYTFLRKRKIHAEFGFTLLSELLVNYDVISRVWRLNIEDDILKRVPIAIKNEQKRHLKKLKDAMASQQKSYIDKWLANSQAIFDVTLLRGVLYDTLINKTSASNVSKRLKQFDRSVAERQEDEKEIIVGQVDLLNEILMKLSQ